MALLAGTNNVDTSTLTALELDPTNQLHQSTYVTGIKESLTGADRHVINLLLFIEHSKELVYAKFSLTSADGLHEPKKGVILYTGISAVGETIF